MKDVPLSPEQEREIATALIGMEGDLNDPVALARYEKQLRRLVQDGANASAKGRIRFREQLAIAQSFGHPEPEEYARNQAAHLAKIEALERRRDRSFRQAKADILKFANKAAAKVEKTSRTAHTSLRRRAQADRFFLATTGVAEKEGRPVKGGLVEAEIQKKYPGYRLPHWEKTTMPLKVMALSVESHKQGAHTINLHLSKDIDEAARRSPRGIVSYMQDRIRKAMKETFADDAPEFWFVLERDNAIRFHLHGAVVIPQPGCEPMIDEALRKAGGSWSQKSFQQVGRPVVEPIYWAHYATKRLNLTVIDIDTRLFASTLGIRQAARDGWDGLRRQF
ncbi:hypothetical protein [Brevundimonas sp. DC300-4]|uniref:hypothetical protein n=1 Tax=Brevundimonas sp. DC300-4 TaxID=2804594 RepID=UPI003CE87BCA